MKILSKLILTSLAILTFIVVFGYAMIYQLDKVDRPLTEDIPNTSADIFTSSTLDGLSQSIRYYDEILTQSARNYAFTQDKKWEERYKTIEPQLDNAIKSAISLGDEKDKQLFASIDKANLALVEMEYKSIELVNNGQSDKAIEILESTAYWDQKKIYQDGLTNYVTIRGTEYNQVLLNHIQKLNSVTEISHNLLHDTTNLFSIAIPVFLIVAMGLPIIIHRNLVRPITNLKSATNEIVKGNFDIQIKSKGNDELASLSNSFTTMANSIKNHLEQIKKMNAQKDEFSSMISHELKTPLVPIKGYCELLIENGMIGNLNPAQHDAVNVIYESSKTLESLITNVLDVQKLDMKKMKFNIEEINVVEALETIYKNYSSLMNEKCIKFVNSIKEATLIKSDKTRLVQVFTNLIKNAVDFVPVEGMIEIGSQMTGQDVVFYVKDNGVGISKENQQNLFKKFYQVDTSLTRKHGGTGLGLVICKGIVEGLGGKIWVESEENHGATFYFSIPTRVEEMHRA